MAVIKELEATEEKVRSAGELLGSDTQGFIDPLTSS
jgi:hypothetical protein